MWIPELINYCKKKCVPLDFITSYHYPTDEILWKSGKSLEVFFRELAERGEVHTNAYHSSR